MEVTPRNTLVAVRLHPLPKTRKVGLITVSNEDKAYCTGEIVAVPPGTVLSEGGQSETHDLEVGQIVLVKHKKPARGPGGAVVWQGEGLDLSEKLVGEENIVLFEQNNILAILEGDLPEDFGGNSEEREYDDVNASNSMPNQIIA